MLFKVCSPAEKAVIDSIIDSGPQNASELDHKVVHGEYWGFMIENHLRNSCLRVLCMYLWKYCLNLAQTNLHRLYSYGITYSYF